MGDGFAFGVEHHHAVQRCSVGIQRTIAAPAGPDVAVHITLDAIKSARAIGVDVQRLVVQPAARTHVVGPYLAAGYGAAFNHIELLLIRREAQTVGPRKVIQHLSHVATRPIDPVHRVRQLLLGDAAFIVVGELERRVGEPDVAAGLADDVVGRIETLALEAVCESGDGAIVLGAADAAGHRAFAGDQATLQVACVAVGVIRGFAKHGSHTGDGVPADDAVVCHIAGQQIAPITKPHGSFHPAKAGRQPLHTGAEQAVFQKRRVQHDHRRVRVTRRQRRPFGRGEMSGVDWHVVLRKDLWMKT